MTPLIWEHVNPYGPFRARYECPAIAPVIQMAPGDTTVGPTPWRSVCRRRCATASMRLSPSTGRGATARRASSRPPRLAARRTAGLRTDGAAAAHPPQRRDRPPPLGERVVPQGARRDPDWQHRLRRREELRPVRGVLPAERAVGAGPRSVLGAHRIPRRSRRGGRAIESTSVGCVRPKTRTALMLYFNTNVGATIGRKKVSRPAFVAPGRVNGPSCGTEGISGTTDWRCPVARAG